MRLDRELKEAGDAALAELGLTPSTAVRALWEGRAFRLTLASAEPARSGNYSFLFEAPENLR